MMRSCLAMVCFSIVFHPIPVEAQHHHSHHHPHSYSVYGFNQPFVAYQYQSFGYSNYWPQQMQVAYYSPVMNLAVPPVALPVKSLATPSTPAARLKSLEHQAKGDQRLREQKWSDARAAYANAVSVAPDRAEAHLRLAVCYVAIQRFELAIQQIKITLKLDPTTPKSAKKLDTLFGPNSTIVRNSVISKLGDWVGEEIHSSDRLFLLGVVLHLNNDPRARDVFESALRMNTGSDSSHITLFLTPPAEQQNGQPIPNPDGIPQLNEQPVSLPGPAKNNDLRFPKSPKPIPGAPVPMPDGPVPMP